MSRSLGLGGGVGGWLSGLGWVGWFRLRICRRWGRGRHDGVIVSNIKELVALSVQVCDQDVSVVCRLCYVDMGRNESEL
jgi:hypothetical protein